MFYLRKNRWEETFGPFYRILILIVNISCINESSITNVQDSDFSLAAQERK